jgi:hypothetical protein
MNDTTETTNQNNEPDADVILPDFVEKMKDVSYHLENAQRVLARGPLSFYLKKLAQQSEALLTRFTPIKIGERAIIVKHINCENGWKGSEMNLAVGVEGDIVNVDFDNGEFVFQFRPDVQKWRREDGTYHDRTSSTTYYLSEAYLHKAR